MADPAPRTVFVRNNSYKLRVGSKKLRGYIVGNPGSSGDFALTSGDQAKYVGTPSNKSLALFEVTKKEGKSETSFLVYFNRAEAEEAMILVTDRE